jgi:N-acetyl-1-D-myo-inositol-2-amino-2-deoxy-alpha-D-glucopyranoside deacetylase
VGRVTTADPVLLPERRLLLVHAHPDDETVGTGATIARYAGDGTHVTLVTCTLGEEGEIHVPALAGLAADQADQLGGYRLIELERACAALGIADHRFLGGAGRYRDSGMMGLPTNDHPRSFWQADVDAAAAELLEVIREIRPQVVITYDERGGYGHPDHIQAHRVAMRAIELAAEVGLAPQRVYWGATPLSVIQAGMKEFAKSTENPFSGIENPEDVPFVVADELIAARIEAGMGAAEAKMAAVRAHATQIPEKSWLSMIATSFGTEFLGIEYFRVPPDAPTPTRRRRPGRPRSGPAKASGRRPPQPLVPSPLAALVPEPAPVEPDGESNRLLEIGMQVAGTVVAVLLAGLAAAYGAFLTPYRIGTSLVPISLVIAAGGNIGVIWFAYVTTRNRYLAMLPAAVWLVLSFLASSRTSDGDLILISTNWVATVYLLVGPVAIAVCGYRLFLRPRLPAS